jgi:hypothetical protein
MHQGVTSMKMPCKSLALLTLAGLLAAPALAADTPVPNINTRGDDEKAFVGKVADAIVTNARTSIKDAMLVKYTKKMPKEGRLEYHIEASYKGVVTKTKYTADIVVHVDTIDKDKWEVQRIEYKDDNKSLVGYNRKKVDKLVSRFNGK